MSCPAQGILNKILTFTTKTVDIDGISIDADIEPIFTIHENELGNPISGYQNIPMEKVTKSVGLYYSSIFLTQNIFNINVNYVIEVIKVVQGSTSTEIHEFKVIEGMSFDAVCYPSLESTKIRAITSSKGRFLQDDWGALLLSLTNSFNRPVNAEDIFIRIYKDDKEIELERYIPLQVDEGNYVFEWVVDKELEHGEYTVIWFFTIDNKSHVKQQQVMIHPGTEQTGQSILYNERLIAFREKLEYALICVQNLPVYTEQAKASRDNRQFSFTYGRWNQSDNIKIFRNQKIITDKATVNFFKGSVIFDERILSQDVISASYNFRWFSDDELDSFLNNSLSYFNSFPPVQNFTLLNVPSVYMTVIVYGAAKEALRQLMLCLQNQEAQQVFGGADRVNDVFNNFQTLEQKYTEDVNKALEVKKYGRYPRMGMNIVPSYTLPGGRCITLDTTVVCIINNNVKKIQLNDLLSEFKKNKNIKILSYDDNKKQVVFAPISNIWLSGQKDVYELQTKSGQSIKASEDHLFFVNKEYIPLSKIKQNDEVVIINNDFNICEDIVTNIIKKDNQENTCDLEVPSTANLFANNIKCHNSRWFRYLFK